MSQQRSLSDREMASIIWRKIKGRELPDSYLEAEVDGIIARYWHRAMDSEQDGDLPGKSS